MVSSGGAGGVAIEGISRLLDAICNAPADSDAEREAKGW